MKAWAGVWMLRSPTNTQAALVSEQITAQVMVNLLHGLTVVAGFPRRPDQRNSLFFFLWYLKISQRSALFVHTKMNQVT